MSAFSFCFGAWLEPSLSMLIHRNPVSSAKDQGYILLEQELIYLRDFLGFPATSDLRSSLFSVDNTCVFSFIQYKDTGFTGRGQND
jgi:hypothetical protein